MTGRAVITGHGWHRRSGSASISHLDHAAHQAVRHLSTCARQRPSAPSGAASDTSDEWRDGDEKNLDEYKEGGDDRSSIHSHVFHMRRVVSNDCQVAEGQLITDLIEARETCYQGRPACRSFVGTRLPGATDPTTSRRSSLGHGTWLRRKMRTPACPLLFCAHL